ncbi:MAG: aminopeptidase P family protein [Bacteroidales bacterium]|nr:aminopeptidase P family protein [Bacteroidales bacterium]
MFSSQTYQKRRAALGKEMASGVALFMGNGETPYNYPANAYRFRQDSSFLYCFGINEPDMAALADFDEGIAYLFGNESTLDDVIWMGEQPSMADRANAAGVDNYFPLSALAEMVDRFMRQGRNIHYLPPYRGETRLQLFRLLGIHPDEQREKASEALIRAVVKMRLVKEPQEIDQIEQSMNTAYRMHTHVMRHARAGVTEQELAGAVEGIAAADGAVSFPVILTVNGQTLHNHYHGNTLRNGQLLLTDAGSETAMGYASDITRTIPVGGKFDERQRLIYQTVLNANLKAIELSRPNVAYRDVHLAVARVIAGGLQQAGLMKGDMDDAVAQGAHSLFFPHGLGHAMGLDVHDMEGMGENYVGYDDTVRRSTQFGLSSVRFGRKLEAGYVVTDEPGIYFIPALMNRWEADRKYEQFINYGALTAYRDFGGIRIEDDLLITPEGCRVLGKPIPKSVEELENICK